jgi:hypothetical protein
MRQLKPISRAVPVHLSQGDKNDPLAIPSADTVQSMHFKHKAVTSAYFSFLLPESAAMHEAPGAGRLSLLEHELSRRGLLYKRITTKSPMEEALSLVSVLVFSIDQQAARRLAQSFQPDKALWCNRTGASKTLLG